MPFEPLRHELYPEHARRSPRRRSSPGSASWSNFTTLPPAEREALLAELRDHLTEPTYRLPRSRPTPGTPACVTRRRRLGAERPRRRADARSGRGSRSRSTRRADALGGGARTAELTLPGFRHDLCSAIHPMGRDSPFFRWAELDVTWVEPPAVVAHPLDDGTAVVLERDLARRRPRRATRAPTARWSRRSSSAWDAVEPLVLGPFPPPRARSCRGARARAPRRGRRAARRALARESTFETDRARALFAGLAAHSMLPLERRPSAGFGLALAVLGHVGGLGLPARRRAGDHRRARRPSCDARRRDAHVEPGRRAPARPTSSSPT